MRKTMLMTVLAGGLLATMTGPLVAQDMHGHGRHGAWGHGYLSFLQGVTLNDSQKSEMHSIMHASLQQMKPQWQQMRALHEQISGELASASTVSPATLASQQQQLETLRAQLDQAELASALQVRQLLTSDQLSQAASVHAQLASLHQQERAVMQQSGSASTTAAP